MVIITKMFLWWKMDPIIYLICPRLELETCCLGFQSVIGLTLSQTRLQFTVSSYFTTNYNSLSFYFIEALQITFSEEGVSVGENTQSKSGSCRDPGCLLMSTEGTDLSVSLRYWMLLMAYKGTGNSIQYSCLENPMDRWRHGKESACQCRRCKRPGFNPWVEKIPWRRKWQHTPVFLPGESHRQRSLAG